MGEYARYGNDKIKIGTCEDMYYLRFDQRYTVRPLSGNVDPVKDAAALRFRFPWPDEDGIRPGADAFHAKGFERSIAVPGFAATPDVEHHSVQFTSHTGYVTSLPCPESHQYTDTTHGSRKLHDAGQIDVRVHRNGFSGAVHLCAQKYREGIGLVPVLRCGGCGSMWRVEDRSEIEAIAVAFRSEADRRERQGQHHGTDQADRAFWDAIADRLLAGLTHAGTPAESE